MPTVPLFCFMEPMKLNSRKVGRFLINDPFAVTGRTLAMDTSCFLQQI